MNAALRPSLNMVRRAVGALSDGVLAVAVFSWASRPGAGLRAFVVRLAGRRLYEMHDEVNGSTATAATPAQAVRRMSRDGRLVLRSLAIDPGDGRPPAIIYQYGRPEYGGASERDLGQAAAVTIQRAYRGWRAHRRRATATFARSFRDASTETRGAGRLARTPRTTPRP